MSVVPGLTRLLASRRLEGLRVGLVCNPASVDAAIAHASDLVFGAPGVTLAALFGPQHGFRADLQDNMIESPHARRRDTAGAGLLPLQRNAGADGRDAERPRRPGRRSAGCRRAHLHVRLHDGQLPARRRPARRPGHRVRPPQPDRRRGGRRADARAGVRVVRRALPHPDAPRDDHRRTGACSSTRTSASARTSTSSTMEGWSREMYFDETGLPWVIPSPNMPTLDTAIVYPGAVLFEGTQLSEGRGTTRPFELLGAPWIDAERFADEPERAGAARRALPARDVRAHVPQARARSVRRLPDPRDATGEAFMPVLAAVAAMAAFHRADPGAVRVAPAAVRIRARQDADRHPGRLARAAWADRKGNRGARESRRRGTRRSRRSAPRAAPACVTDACRGSSRHPGADRLRQGYGESAEASAKVEAPGLLLQDGYCLSAGPRSMGSRLAGGDVSRRSQARLA